MILSLSRYMQKLGYKADDGGVCYGVAMMGIQAMLSEEMEIFDKRLRIMAHDQMKMSPSFNKQRYECGIYAFLDGVEVHLQPDEHPELFSSEKPIKSQNALISSSLVTSQKIQEQNGLRRNSAFSGTYSKDELQNYLKTLRTSAENAAIQKPFGLLLLRTTHAISIGFDPKTKRWMLVDGKMLPTQYFNDELTLSNAIIKTLNGMQPTKYVSFASECYSTKDNEAIVDSVMGAWQQTDAWKAMHSQTKPKVEFVHPTKGSWLLIAAQCNQLETVKTLLANGADPNVTDCNGLTPIYMAAQNDHLDVLNALLASPNIKPDLARRNGKTPLISACEDGNVDVVAALLRSGKVDPNHEMENNVTPLIAAAQFGKVEVVRLLLDSAKVNVNHKTKEGLSAFYMAAQNGHHAVVREFLERDIVQPDEPDEEQGITPLIIAAIQGHATIVEDIIKKTKADVNRRIPQEGLTALHIATMNGHSNVVKVLLDSDMIDVNQKDDNGRTALSIARLHGRDDISKQLLEYRRSGSEDHAPGESKKRKYINVSS